MPEIGKRIKARREELGMTQEELAARLGYKSKTTIALLYLFFFKTSHPYSV